MLGRSGLVAFGVLYLSCFLGKHRSYLPSPVGLRRNSMRQSVPRAVATVAETDEQG